MVSKSHRIVFFGGAGVSTESGIPDFRSVDGLYNQIWDYPPETILSHSFFLREPEIFYKFYREKMIYPDAAPNPAHRALAAWEAAGKLSCVITQNIDGLHQAAGSKNVLELHGSVHQNACTRCKRAYGLEAIMQSSGVPRCDCGGIIKPKVVLYEEPLDDDVMNRAAREISQADMLLIGGTSLSVYPAAGLVQFFSGKYIAVVNKAPTPMDDQADVMITLPIGQTLEKIHF
jgi:NAD-dependent deacetylase